ncbi:MAG: mucoidy inhibitor MuiA family protein [Myxococcales bacterium]|nr:mucoidy inhibitor MuiA family protein [Myxococcales bacterium]
MKALFSLLALLVAAPAAQAQAPIERVVVFGDRAQVTRKADVKCVAGRARVEFFPLPLALDERTVRAEATDGAEAVGTTLSQAPLAPDLDARRAALKARVDALAAELAAGRAKSARVGRQEQLGERYGQYTEQVLREGFRNPRPDPGLWGRTLDQLRADRVAARTARIALEAELQRLGDEHAVAQRELARLGPGTEGRGRKVEVAVDCRQATRTTVRLAYVVAGASWRPEYDLRFQPRGEAVAGPGDVELGISAVIAQSTGEDWTDARLVLSSARPWLGVQAPTPRAISVYTQKVPEQKVLVQAQEKREALAGGEAGGGRRAATDATVADAGTAVTLTLPRPVTVRADGRPYWVPVDTIKAAATAKLVALPAHSPFVYQVVQLKNPAGYPLLAGPVHLYRRGAYMGDDQLEHAGPGAPLEISLGIDSTFRLERGPKKEVNGRPGFLSDTRHLQRVYEIVLRSGARAPAEIEVREQIPVSKNAVIKVALAEKLTTAGYVVDRERGLVTWPVQLKPGGESRLDLAYTVDLPEDWKLR